MTTGGKSRVCAGSLWWELYLCVLVNLHRVTHTPGITAGVCQFTVSLAHSIPNPQHRGKTEREREREIKPVYLHVKCLNNLHFTGRLSCPLLPPLVLTCSLILISLSVIYSRIRHREGSRFHRLPWQQTRLSRGGLAPRCNHGRSESKATAISQLPFSSSSFFLLSQWPNKGHGSTHHCDLWCWRALCVCLLAVKLGLLDKMVSNIVQK